MEPVIEKGPFESTILLREIRLGRKNFSEKLVLEPSQISSARDLVMSAMRIENLPLLPRRLHSSPFSIVFDSNREMDLVLVDKNNEFVHFEFSEGDNLLELLDSSYQKWRDLGKMERTRTEGFSTSSGAEFSPPS